MLEGMIYSGLRFYREDTVSVAVITRKMIDACGATTDDLEDIASLACRPDGAKICITIREREDGKSKVSVPLTGLKATKYVLCSAGEAMRLLPDVSLQQIRKPHVRC